MVQRQDDEWLRNRLDLSRIAKGARPDSRPEQAIAAGIIELLHEMDLVREGIAALWNEVAG